jgi:cyclic pyranopterin phosphate synthase
MRNVSLKTTTLRTAHARAELIAAPSTLAAIKEGRIPKGDPLPVAKVAAIMATKKTTEWIPYCHNIPIEHVDIHFELQSDRIIIDIHVSTVAKTGVEMEAMTGAAAAALTLYDMLKMLDDTMEIVGIKLLEKRGGKSDYGGLAHWTGAVMTVSDRASKGVYEDQSGPILRLGLEDWGATSVSEALVSDDIEAIQSGVAAWITQGVDIILITGGSGIGSRDVTPEAIKPLIERELPGVSEQFRRYGQDRLKTAMFSRCVCGVAGSSLILALPGSPGACDDALHALFPGLLHAILMLGDGGHP